MCLEKTKLCLVTICPCKQMCVWVKNRMWRLRFKQQLWKCLCWLWWYKQCDSSQTLWRCGWTHRYPSLVSSHMLQYVRMGAINVVAGSLNSEEHLVSHTRFLCHCRQSCVFVCVCVCHSSHFSWHTYSSSVHLLAAYKNQLIPSLPGQTC